MTNYSRVFRSISDDDLCSDCAHLGYKPGGLSSCTVDASPEFAQVWPAQFDADGYAVACAYYLGPRHEAKVPGELGSFLSSVQQRAEDLRREAALAQGLLTRGGGPDSWLDVIQRMMAWELARRPDSGPGMEADLLGDVRAAIANRVHEAWRAPGRLLEGTTEEDALAVACLLADPALTPGFIVRAVDASGRLVRNRVYAHQTGLVHGLVLLLLAMAQKAEREGRGEDARALVLASNKVGKEGLKAGDTLETAGIEFRVLEVEEESWALPRREVQNA